MRFPSLNRVRPSGLWEVVLLLLIGGFVLVTLGPALVGRGTLLDVGTLSATFPVRAVTGSEFASVITCRSDTYDYYMPGIAQIKRGIFAGDIPTWSPYEVGGSPLASLPNHGALSPLSLPYFLLPLWLAPAVVKLVEMLVAITGMVLFLGRHGVRRSAGLLAGLVFVSSGFMMMWTNWPHTRVAAFIPLLFWALDRAVTRPDTRSMAAVGVVVASMLLGGFPAITLFALTWGAAYVVTRVAILARTASGLGSARATEPSRWQSWMLATRRLATPAAGVGLGLGLSAIQVLPFAANISQLDFAGRDNSGSRLPLGAALTTVAPAVRGLCVGGDFSGDTIPIEAVGFLGGPALVLLAGGLLLRVRDPRDRAPSGFLLLGALVMGLAIWVGGIVLTTLEVLPLYDNNLIWRGQSLFGFLVAALVGVAFNRLLSSQDESSNPSGESIRGRPRWTVLVVLLLALGVTILVGRSAWSDARRDGYLDRVQDAVVLPLVLVVLAVIALLVLMRSSGRRRTAATLFLVLLIVGQSTAFAHTMLRTSHRDTFYPTTPTHRFLQENIGPNRYASAENMMAVATSDYYRLRTPIGHEFTDQRWKDLLIAAGADQRSPTFSLFPFDLPFERVRISPILDRLATEYWVAPPGFVVGQTDALSDSEGTVTLSPGSSGQCSVPGGPIRGIQLVVAEDIPRAPSGQIPAVHVEIRSGDVVRRGARLVDGGVLGGTALSVAVVGEDLTGPDDLEVRVWTSGTQAAPIFATGQTGLDCAAVRARRDGVRLVFADAGGAVYRRLRTLDRVRWASTTRVVADPDRRVAELAAGLPADSALLERRSLRAAEGGQASVDLVSDGAERISVEVDAATFGYLVIADSIARPGWTATVDGVERPLVRADHALAAVGVPEGRHRVELVYEAPRLGLGRVVTGISGLATLLLIWMPWLVRRRPRRRLGGGSASVWSDGSRPRAGDQKL